MNITTDFQTFEAKSLCPLDAREAVIDEVWSGLLKRPRSLVPWMLYDSEGSRLFECITTLPEYYPTRTERDILANYAEAIIRATGSDYARPLRLLELGAGTAAKTGILLEAATRLRDEVIYFPVDVSSDALDAACDSIGCLLPDVQLQPMVANYVTHPPKLERFKGTTLAMYIGSSIGNFSPEEARTILRNLRSELRAGDALLLGTDMVKDEATLVRAYDDRDGVTAAFNLNVLHRLNRELGANFDTGCFRHRARWNRVESRIEMHLESTRGQCVNIPAAQLSVEFAALETIHTESSYKFTRKAPAEDRSVRLLKEELQLSSNTDFLSDAVALFRWAVSERELGHRIMSESASGERNVLLFPRLERVAPGLVVPRVEINWTARELESLAKLVSAGEANRPTDALIRAMRD